MFSLGIGVGRRARPAGKATAHYVTVTLLGISLFTWDFATSAGGAIWCRSRTSSPRCMAGAFCSI
jgi:hypothetical protein